MPRDLNSGSKSSMTSLNDRGKRAYACQYVSLT
jgi:hypothetical protein